MVAVASPHQIQERLEITGTYETFLRLVQENDSPGKKFAYSDGLIEVKVPGKEHEALSRLISLLISTYCLEKDIEFFLLGSTTQREDFAEKGLEPDESFCFQIDKDIPHLALEVIHTHGSIDKLEIYKSLNVKEVWFASVSTGDIKAYSLSEGLYEPVMDSQVLMGLSLSMIKESLRMDSVSSAVKKLKELI